MKTSFSGTKISGIQLPEYLKIHYRRQRIRMETLLFQCEVMFGSPSSNCGGNGICKIVAKPDISPSAYQRTSCSRARAFFTVWDGGNGASLLFHRNWLCSNLMRRYFRHGVLEMPEPCSIPPALVAAFQLRMQELPAGLHLIEDYGTHFRINFQQKDII